MPQIRHYTCDGPAGCHNIWLVKFIHPDFAPAHAAVVGGPVLGSDRDVTESCPVCGNEQVSCYRIDHYATKES